MLLEPPPEPANRPHRARRRRGTNGSVPSRPEGWERDYKRAAIYLRISFDKAGDEHGVENQEARARAICKARGWEVVACFIENNKSAYDAATERKKFKQLLKLVRDDGCDVIVADAWDRLIRQNRDGVDLSEVIEQQRVLAHLLNGGDSKLWNPADALGARVLTAVAIYEVEQRAWRMRNDAESRAVKGLPPVGGPRAFGFTKDGMTHVPEEADAIRWGVDHVLSGGSVRDVTREWERRGVKTARTNGGMNDRAVNVILRNPRNAGIRCLYENEKTTEAVWPAIIGQDTYRRLLNVLDNPARRTTPGPARKHLLSGIIVCGVCAAEGEERACRVISACSKGRKWRTYGCNKDRRSGAHLSRVADPIEETVIHEVLDYLAKKACDEMLDRQGADIEALRAQRADVRAEREAIVAGIANGDLSMRVMQKQLAALKTQIEALDKQILDHTTDPAVSEIVQSVLRSGEEHVKRLDAAYSTWEDYTLSQRRSLIQSLVTITLLPAARRGVFDPAEVVFSWTR